MYLDISQQYALIGLEQTTRVTGGPDWKNNEGLRCCIKLGSLSQYYANL